MTVREFEKQNKDILRHRLTVETFNALTDGMVLFCVTTNAGIKPIEERAVRTAGYQLVVATTRNPERGNLVDICTLALTAGGWAKVDIITADDISGLGNKVVYFCKPLNVPNNDPRRNHHWLPRRES